NPMCIRHSGVRAPEVWRTGPDTTAREYILAGGGRIVGARVMGQSLLVWTTDRLFIGSFVGALNQPWRFDPVGEGCGLVGPNAAAVAGGQAVWLAPDLQFRRYAPGGPVEVLACPVRGALAAHLAPGQADKISACVVSAFDEVRFDYPDARDGVENSRYLALSLRDGAWSRGVMARSAFTDAGPQENPVGVDPEGSLFWHERGASADGARFSWFIETADQHLDVERTLMVRGLWPDLADQVGPAAVTLISRLTPQGDETVWGPHAIAPGQDRLDLRAAGRLFRLRLSGHAAPTAGRIGQPVVDVAAAGRR
ncbi:MAG: hypothetical protein LPK04_12645, partial [Caulobacteraceae bacterium]|nr:hypothetical protein [Caulobacteraceae bacterium]